MREQAIKRRKAHILPPWPEGIDQLHSLWFELSEREDFGVKLHHRDIISFAMEHLERDLKGGEREKLLSDICRQLQ